MRHLIPLCLLVACGGTPTEEPDTPDSTDSQVDTVVYSCAYAFPFAVGGVECRDYVEGWTEATASDNCAGLQDATFSTDPCATDQPLLGRCRVEAEPGAFYESLAVGDDVDTCADSERGCEVFGGGTFLPSEICADEPDVDFDQGGTTIFVQPTLECATDNDSASVWQSISGCAPEGYAFDDLASCDPVRSQRGYYPVPTDAYETPEDDPIRSDADFLAELEWVTGQVEACGCVCCHSSERTPQGPSNWYIEDGDIWTDGFFPSGLAMAAGWTDSQLLGAYPPEDNNGFSRPDGIPTDDVARMRAFFDAEARRRGLTPEQFEDVPPGPAIFYNQFLYEPEACQEGNGIDEDGRIIWVGGSARYVYVLEADAENPLSPPNYDEPEGTLWLIEVPWTEDPMTSGIPYGEVTAPARQRVPESGAPPALTPGGTYYLHTQRDVGDPIARCLFTVPE